MIVTVVSFMSNGGTGNDVLLTEVSSRLLFLFDANDGGEANKPSAIIKRHNNGANLLFLDGHAEWRTQLDPAGTEFWIGKWRSSAHAFTRFFPEIAKPRSHVF